MPKKAKLAAPKKTPAKKPAAKTTATKSPKKRKPADLSKYTKKVPQIPVEIIKAFNHELRRGILGVLLDKSEPTSPAEVAEALGEPLSNVAYHFRVLAHECKVVELKKTGKVRGATEHFYKINASTMRWIKANK